jgi:hypothetical protein
MMNQKIILHSVLVLTCLCLMMCGGSQSDDSNGDDNDSDSTPVLYNLGIDFDDFDYESLGERDPLIAFGDVLSGTQLNPTFEYYLTSDATIIAPVSGTITDITERDDTNDYSIVITPTDASSWWVVLDHVLNVSVVEGDAVSAGDSLGTAGTWEDNIGRTELQVLNNDDGLSYCPTALLDSSVETQEQNNIINLITTWEEDAGDTSIYDENSMSPAGCLEETVQG